MNIIHAVADVVGYALAWSYVAFLVLAALAIVGCTIHTIIVTLKDRKP